jgi:hypothetical protein
MTETKPEREGYHKPLVIPPDRLRPLPENMWGTSCDKCDKRQANWEYWSPKLPPTERRGYLVCSLCWLYRSDWGREHSADIAQYIALVEQSARVTFQRTANNQLLMCNDADRILGAIVLTSRMFVYRGRLMKGSE